MPTFKARFCRYFLYSEEDLELVDQVIGEQYETYYHGVCYAPLYIFCGHRLLAAKLRSSNVEPAVCKFL